MSVVVLGDEQAVAAAGYVAAVTGRPVDLVRQHASQIEHVRLDGRTVSVQVNVRADLPEAELEAVLVVGQSRHLYELLRPLAFRLGGVPVLLAPGGFAGVLRVQHWFDSWGLVAPVVGEATGFPAGGHLNRGCLTLRSIKHALPIAGPDHDTTSRLKSTFVRLLPHLIPSDLTTTSLSNTNHMIHPGVVLVNAARVDNGEPFTFYRSGISPAVSRLLHAVDAERQTLVDRLGGNALGVRDWMKEFYGSEGMTGANIVECLSTFEPFETVAGPGQLDYRYLVDDVPFGLAQWADLARSFDVDAPYMHALLTLLRALAPDLNLQADEQAASLFRQFLSTHQGVPA